MPGIAHVPDNRGHIGQLRQLGGRELQLALASSVDRQRPAASRERAGQRQTETT
jgi:hypothetical protein